MNRQSDPSVQCPGCHRSLPPDSPNQLCPYCLLASQADDATVAWAGGSSRPGFQPPPPEALQPHFESLEIGPLVGFGGMGAVYRAHQRSLGRDVALKILLPEVAVTEGFTDRFLREARALARLGHPNVVAVYDHGTTGPYAFLVMELVEGVNLRELMAGEKLPVQEALRIVPQLCDALQFAHSRGVVHRDIKPENILIEESGHVKITDFGLAKLGQSDERHGRTGTRQVMGTVHYMAPEQIERPREVDHRADLYSLGVVFYELLTGELPLGRFRPPSAKSGTSAEVDRVVLKSLEKEPDRRYASAQDVRADLDRSGEQSADRIKAAAAKLDQTFHRATESVKSTWQQRGVRSWLPVAATLAFYLIALISILSAANLRDPFAPGITLAAVLLLAAFALDRLYRRIPLPDQLAWAGWPVSWSGRLPTKLYQALIDAADSIDGLRKPWMLAAVVAFIVAVGGALAGFLHDDDFIPLALIGAPLAWIFTRLALPDSASPQSPSARLLTLPPVLLTLVPLAIVFLFWPVPAWLLLIVDTPPLWFGHYTGIDVGIEQARATAQFDLVKAQLFGGLTIELMWLTVVALVVAGAPDVARWIARPLLDHWTGRGRWILLLGLATVTILMAAIWAL